MTLGSLINNLETLPKVIQKEVDEIVLSDSAVLNREQLEKGKRADDKDVQFPDGRTTYSKGYKKLKQRLGKQNKHIDLKLTGDFHKSIETKKRRKGTYENVSGDTLYTGKLRPTFGSEILGLNKEATEKLNKKIENSLRKILFKL